MAKKLAPYVDLAARLAAFLAQVSDVSPTSLDDSSAWASRRSSAPSPSPRARWRASSALRDHTGQPGLRAHVAADRGITVRELSNIARVGRAQGKYAAQVIMRVGAADGSTRAVEGTLGSDGSPRLTRWGDVDVEAVLGGTTLVVESHDRPGVIGFLGTTLGKRAERLARPPRPRRRHGHQPVEPRQRLPPACSRAAALPWT